MAPDLTPAPLWRLRTLPDGLVLTFCNLVATMHIVRSLCKHQTEHNTKFFVFMHHMFIKFYSYLTVLTIDKLESTYEEHCSIILTCQIGLDAKYAIK